MENIEKIVKNPKRYASKITIEDLVDLLEMLSDAYFNTGEPIVSDSVYDELVAVLKDRDPDNEYLKTVGAPVVGTKQLVKLPYEMGSLSKIKPGGNELAKWLKKYKGIYYLSDKLDGVSAQIYKNLEGDLFLYSRGDGVEGQDISHLLNYVAKKSVLKNLPNGTSVRGELIISKEDFKKYQKKIKMKNARNAVAGLVNAKHFNQDVAKITNFVAYSILSPRLKYKNQMEHLEKWGFNVVVNRSVKKIDEEILKDYLKERKTDTEYEIDGIVCFDDEQIYSHSGGYPEYAFAFKMLLDEQIATTKVVEVIWTPSKDGYLKPRIKINPVELTGTTVTYATAFNAKYIVDNGIGPSAEIRISRSGDVIPYILEVTKPSPAGAQLPDYPYKWNKTDVDLILKNEDDSNGKQVVTIKVLKHFFSTIGVKYMSEGIITKLVENGLDTVVKILKVDKKKLYIIDGLGEKMVDKIYKEIDKAFSKVSLEDFMSASNELGRNLGSRKIKEILNVYPDILTNHSNLYNKIIQVPGFSDKLTLQFEENFERFLKFYNKIAEIVDLSRFEKIQTKKKGGQFDGKSIVLTGFRDSIIEKFITDNGGKVTSSVSKNTFLVIYSGSPGSKYTKAKELGITTIKKDDFVNKYM